MLFDLFSSTRSRYWVLNTFHGHTKSVYSLDFSIDGRYLASGGGDGMKLWDLKSNTSLRYPQHRAALGPVSQVLWIPTRSRIPSVCYGTGLGHICMWAQNAKGSAFMEVFTKRLGGGAEILGLAYEVLSPTDTRILVTDRSGFVGVYSWDGRAELLPVFTTRLVNAVPISASFANSKCRKVYVFGLHDGTMYKLSGTDGKILTSKNLSDKIGHASVAAKEQLVVVDNVGSGFNVWDLNPETHQRTFPTGQPTRFLPRQVAFVDDARAIVGGSDHGAVYVFERKTGAPLEVLRHAQQGLVQTISTTERDSVSLIASGTSCGTGTIRVWQAKKLPVASDKRSSRPSLGSLLQGCIQFLMLLAAVAFCWQNLGYSIDLHAWVQSAALVVREAGSSQNMMQVSGDHGVRQVPVNRVHTVSQPASTAGTSRWNGWRTYIEGGEAQRTQDKGAGRGSETARGVQATEHSASTTVIFL
ncbi:WD40 repeat-like protein [Trametes meyenii]|nr:WD40 repeat-like protein [Trametes meyenii]